MDIETSETSSALWSAVWQLADAWSDTPVVRQVGGALPRNRPVEDIQVGATGLPALLHQLAVRAGLFMHPLRCGSRIPVLLQHPLLADVGRQQVDESEFLAWLENAAKLELAHRRTLAWLRSSMAGYPVLRAPQLAPGTPQTTDEMSTRFTWSKAEFLAGLNRLPNPPEVPELLGANAPARGALNGAARELANQLCASPAWTDFTAASAALDENTKTELRSARRELRERLSDERLDEHEPTLLLARSAYRTHTTADVIDALTGPARHYAVAFNNVDSLLTLTACDIFAELALYGQPRSVQVQNVEAPEPGRPIVEFESEDESGVLHNPGQVLWLRSTAVLDAVRLDQISFKMDLAHGTREQYAARVLQGTAEGWPHDSSTHLPST